VKTGLVANAESFSSVERGRKAEMNLGSAGRQPAPRCGL